jgi:hypothetical protein
MPKVSKAILMEMETDGTPKKSSITGKGLITIEGSNHFPDSRGNKRLAVNWTV